MSDRLLVALGWGWGVIAVCLFVMMSTSASLEDWVAWFILWTISCVAGYFMVNSL